MRYGVVEEKPELLGTPEKLCTGSLFGEAATGARKVGMHVRKLLGVVARHSRVGCRVAARLVELCEQRRDPLLQRRNLGLLVTAALAPGPFANSCVLA